MVVAAALLAAATAVGLQAAQAALAFMPSLNLRSTALTRAVPVAGPPSRRLAQRVVLVIVDGLRLDASFGRPFLDSVRARGVDSRARSHFPTLSHPNYVSIVAGVEPRWSGVRTNDTLFSVNLDSLLLRAQRGGMAATFVSNMAHGVPQLFAHQLAHGAIASWPGGLEATARAVLASDDDLVIMLIGDLDETGHRYGGDSAMYRAVARDVDAMLGRLLSGFDFGRDALVIVADHGHIDHGGHGGLEPEVVNVPLLLAGAGVHRGATVLDAELIDLAPTVSALLGLPAPGHGLGRVLVDALAVTADERALFRRADALRRATLLPVLASAAVAEQHAAVRSRLRRGALVLAGLAALMVGTGLAIRRGVVRVDRRVLLIAVPTFPLTFYGMVLTFERFLSPSMLPGRDPLAVGLIGYGALAAAANLIGAWSALRGRGVPCERLAANAGLVLVGMIVALAPASIAWAAAGPTMTSALPGARALLMPPVTYMAVACYAASAAVTLAIEYVVFLARAFDPARLVLP